MAVKCTRQNMVKYPPGKNRNKNYIAKQLNKLLYVYYK